MTWSLTFTSTMTAYQWLCSASIILTCILGLAVGQQDPTRGIVIFAAAFCDLISAVFCNLPEKSRCFTPQLFCWRVVEEGLFTSIVLALCVPFLRYNSYYWFDAGALLGIIILRIALVSYEDYQTTESWVPSEPWIRFILQVTIVYVLVDVILVSQVIELEAHRYLWFTIADCALQFIITLIPIRAGHEMTNVWIWTFAPVTSYVLPMTAGGMLLTSAETLTSPQAAMILYCGVICAFCVFKHAVQVWYAVMLLEYIRRTAQPKSVV